MIQFFFYTDSPIRFYATHGGALTITVLEDSICPSFALLRYPLWCKLDFFRYLGLPLPLSPGPPPYRCEILATPGCNCASCIGRIASGLATCPCLR